MLVLKGLVGLHKTIQLQFLQHYCLGHRLGSMNLGIKIVGRNITNLRYADNTTLMAESEEQLKSILMKVKEESEKVGLSSTFKKLGSWHLVPSLHGK